MRRALIVAAGLLIALPAALVVMAIGLLMLAPTLDASTGADFVAVAASVGELGSSNLLEGLVAVWLAVLALCLIPVAIAGLVGEAARLREPVWYAGVAGALTAGVPTFVRAILDFPAPGEGRVTLVLVLTGAASGFVYWLVAGRTAGAP